SAKNEGLKLIKPAGRSLIANDIPQNWRDNVEVVKRGNKNSTDVFERLSQPYLKTEKGPKHVKLAEKLGQICNAGWHEDGFLFAHSCGFRALTRTFRRTRMVVTCGRLIASPT